jgi:hypothetical protein
MNVKTSEISGALNVWGQFSHAILHVPGGSTDLINQACTWVRKGERCESPVRVPVHVNSHTTRFSMALGIHIPPGFESHSFMIVVLCKFSR